MKDGFVKVAAGTPKIRVADCAYNADQIIALMEQAAEQGVQVLVLPELCVTGCTCGDLFLQDVLLDGAAQALAHILAETSKLDLITALGLPVRAEGRVYNCAALIYKGEQVALVRKAELTLEERRWFAKGESAAEAYCELLPEVSVGVDVGGSIRNGKADLVLSLAADPEWSGRGDARRALLARCSFEGSCAIVRATAGDGESTTDFVFGGHRLIVNKGTLVAEDRFSSGLTVGAIDLAVPAVRPVCGAAPQRVSAQPFLPGTKEGLEEILTIAALGLKKRLEHAHAPAAVIGLSGGLDSTLAILTTARAFDLLGRDRKDIIAITMPCFGTTARTKSNAEKLAEELGATLKIIDIGAAVRQHFADIGHDMEDHSVTFENGQARERTQVLMDMANRLGGLVIGTGDLSELALGWCTYNGDHMSMYAVNGGIPKTLMRHLVAYEAERAEDGLARVLLDILDTPVSPELLPPKDGEIAQRTEDLVGPYELHDFYLYYAICRGFRPRDVFRLAQEVLCGIYDDATLLKWLKNFYRRFFSQQFKRSCMPDGPQVTELSLSPRGNWQMPSDGVAALWLKELEELE